MKWPFVRHSQSPPASRGTGSTKVAEPAQPEAHRRAVEEIVAPSRREWATLPPLHVAGGRPISLTVATRAFTDGLASRQVLVRAPRLEHVRQLDAPSGSFRGILSPSVDEEGATPELQAPSALPAVEHRQVAALAAEQAGAHGLSPIEQLLAIGERDERAAAPTTPADAVFSGPADVDEPGDGGGFSGRRAGLADSRRRGLGPAYHGPLPEAMRAERDRLDERGTTEAVPGDVRAAMRDLLGVDVGDRLVHRGPAVSAEARAMGAQAFTRDGQVHVADEVGPLDQPTGRAALAHELTHAAQQITSGTLPDEGSAMGRALEAHAQQVEQYVRGDGGAIKPSPELLHARPPTTDSADAELTASTRQMMRDLVDSGLARPDGTGGIIFTMPPSSMTATTGTQRQTATAPPVHAASQEHWNPLETLGHNLGQGLANDMLSIGGSFLGFSDEFMGEQRHDLVGDDRQFRREQVSRAYTDLRMEHLRKNKLTDLNAMESRFGAEHSTSLDDDTVKVIEHQVEKEIADRMALLDAQSAKALDQLNEKRKPRHEPALLDVPDENFNAALTKLFDDVEASQLPTEDEMLAMLTQASTTGPGGARRPGGAAAAAAAAAAARTSGATPTTGTPTTGTPSTGTPSTGTAPTGTGTGTGTGAPSTGTGTGTGTPPTGAPGAHGGTDQQAEPEEHWRTDPTMGGRFKALGTALVGDIANAEVGFFGSLLGFDQKFEQGMHDDISGHHAAAAAGTAPGAHGAADAAHGDAAHGAAAAAHTGAAHGDAAHQASPAAHEAVEKIVHDAYSLDELANRLYPNIRTRLRQELLIDRERAGLLADFR